MKKFGTKLVAVATAAAMAFAFTPAVVFAAEDSQGSSATGVGKVEGVVDKEVFSVDLPTISEGAKPFDFILDPQGLIKATSNAAHQKKSFSDGSLFFSRAQKPDEGGADYMPTSDSLTATNKGTTVVDVALSANITTNLSLTSDSSFADDTTPSIYLALSNGGAPKPLTADGITLKSSLDAAPESAYEVKYDSSSQTYSYALTDEAKGASYSGFKSVNFSMTGACNTKADWTGLENEAPSVNVSWTLSKHVDRYLTETTITAANPVLNISLPDEVTISSVKLGDITLASGNHYSYNASAGTITFQSAHITTWKAGSYTSITFTYSDGKTEEVAIQ